MEQMCIFSQFLLSPIGCKISSWLYHSTLLRHCQYLFQIFKLIILAPFLCNFHIGIMLKCKPFFSDSEITDFILEFSESNLATYRTVQFILNCCVSQTVNEIFHNAVFVNVILGWQAKILIGVIVDFHS